jgi:signal transduction histidine kinase
MIAFSTVFIAIRLVLNNFVRIDATNKLETTVQQTNELANSIGKSTFYVLGKNDIDTNLRTLVETVSGSSDVDAALLNSEMKIEWPKSSVYNQDRSKAISVLSELGKLNTNIGDGKIYVVNIGSSTYCVASIQIITYNDQNNEQYNEPDFYLLLYLDISQYEIFARSLDKTLYIILFSALLLSLAASLIVSNSIIKSLHKLTDFASKIGSGDFRPVDLNLLDKELDSLASNMNSMAIILSNANMEQKTFFQNASHELRTPLMSIQGYAEGIKYKIFDDVDPAVDVIISESKRLTDMVENLLAISRLDMTAAGLQTTNKSTLSLYELLESVVEKVRGSILLSHKNLSQHFDGADINICGNEGDLFRAFENVLSNAIRHSNLNIDLHVRQNSDGLAEVTISDDGQGISESLLPNIFNRFVQGEGGKHGIGLALVKAIIVDHKGDIYAHNRAGEETGAIFTILLPVANSGKKQVCYPVVADRSEVTTVVVVSDSDIVDDSD